MSKRTFVGLLLLMVLALLLIFARRMPPAVEAQRVSAPAQRIAAPVSCFPGTGGPPVTLTPRAYLPLILTNGTPPPAACSIVEVEPNDTHTDAQTLVSTCVAGSVAWSGDLDWYRIDACSTITATVSLHGPNGTDFDLYLYGYPPGAPIALSENSGSIETIMAANLISGTTYGLISAVSGTGSYSLNAEAA
jgi:hypothetical protein